MGIPVATDGITNANAENVATLHCSTFAAYVFIAITLHFVLLSICSRFSLFIALLFVLFRVYKHF